MIGRPELVRAHFPTGRVSVEEFLRLVIETFDVKTRRKDWQTVLQQTQAAFARWRTWA
jgi:crotonobetainyl-CoA:carnitine CoA-transferase CaiB-like acyl-CoA transferase